MAHVFKKKVYEGDRIVLAKVSTVRSGTATAARSRWKACATASGQVFAEEAGGKVVVFRDDSGRLIRMTWWNV